MFGSAGSRAGRSLKAGIVSGVRATAARAQLAVLGYVTNRAFLASIAGFSGQVVFLGEAGREGAFKWSATAHAADVTNDPNQGVYVPPASDKTGASGAWVRALADVLYVEWFGTVGDGSTDDAAALQAAINLTNAMSTGGNVPHFKLRSKAGSTFKINYGLLLNQPIDIYIASPIKYNATTGDAITVNSVAPVTYGNQGYNIWLAELDQSNGQNTSTPSSVNGSGASGLRINSLAFSYVRVDVLQGFTKYGIYCDGTGGVYSPQVIQHVTFTLGQLVNNGNAIFMDSLNAATSSCQVCKWFVQDAYQSFSNIVMNNTASDSHTFFIDASDGCNAGGYALQCTGKWNFFYFGYTGATVRMEAGTAGTNTVYIANTLATGAAFSDASTPVNWLTSGGGVDQPGQIRTLLGLDGAWTAYTPTVSSGTGTLTTASATGKYKQIGTKTYAFQIEATITTNGTGATSVIVSLPAAAKNNTPFAGRGSAVSGKALSGNVSATGTNVAITNYDNTYPGANGEHILLAGIYELN